MKILGVCTTLLLYLAPFCSAQTVDLDGFLSLVEANSKDLKLARKERELADVQKKEARATALPKLFAQADYKRNLTDLYLYADLGSFFGTGGGPTKLKINRKNEYSSNAVLQQTLFSPTIGNAIKAARQYQQLTDLVYAASYQTILSIAKQLFYQTLLLEQVWEVSAAAQQNAHDNYLNVKKKFELGLVSELELLQAEVRWKNSIPAETEAKRNYLLALNNLKNWAGIPEEEDFAINGTLTQYPPKPERIDFPTLLSLRPDYNALLWEEKLRKTNVSAQRASYFPTLTGSLVAAFSSQSDYWKFEQRNYTYVAGLTLSVPIFTGGYTSAQVEKAKIELEKTRVRINKSRQDIYNEMDNIYLRLDEAHERIVSAHTTLHTAEKAFFIAETTTESGLTTQLELKETRVGYDQAQLNYYAAIFDYLSAYFDWERAAGVGEAQ